MKQPLRTLVALALLAGGAPAVAGGADVVGATASLESAGTWRFDVTVLHADEGWEHYADRWDVLAPDGSLIASRTLLHPHVDEQPFTRSIAGVTVPQAVSEVVIRAHDKVHGTGGRKFRLALPR